MSRKASGQTALEIAARVLAETEEKLKCLLVRGDVDVQDEATTIKWMMRVKVAKSKVRSALRRMQ